VALGKGHRSSNHPPTHIADELIRRDVFVFMGRLQPAESIDYELVVSDFDRLLPLYRFVEGTKTFPELSEAKDGGFRFEAGCTPRPSSTTATVVQRELDVRLRHNEVEFALYRHLASIHGEENVRAEIANVGGLVDVSGACRRSILVLRNQDCNFCKRVYPRSSCATS